MNLMKLNLQGSYQSIRKTGLPFSSTFLITYTPCKATTRYRVSKRKVQIKDYVS